MPSPAGDTGSSFPLPDVSGIEPPKKRKKMRMSMLPQWDEVLPILARATVLMGVAYFAGNAQTGEVADALLLAEENAATTQEVRATEATRTDDAYREYHELVTYHAVADAECDAALEVYERHMGDAHEWSHVLSGCHSEAPAHNHTDDPTLPAEDPHQ